MAQAPLAYAERYPKARLYDQTEADNYIRHTNIGDPVMDSLMEELSSLPPQDLHGFIEAGIEQHDEVLRSAPQVRAISSRILKSLPGSTTKPFVQGFAPSTQT